ncbi:MAG: hypothetical protein JW839_07175 [Candidatus Lokiarchaeota archaeon]|nr:hypothetical protein [Candidatus Lokiarchaeota archaeon]
MTIGYILHGCNELPRVQLGLQDPSLAGIEVDIRIDQGHVRVGHDPSSALLHEGMSLAALGNQLPGPGKILVADLKGPGWTGFWSVDEGTCMVEALYDAIPTHVPIFITGPTFDWVPLIERTLDALAGREVTYFIDALSLRSCKQSYRNQGVRFGLNFGDPVEKVKRTFLEEIPSRLEQTTEYTDVVRAIKPVILAYKQIEMDAWNEADVRMAWTITSTRMLEEIRKLEPDYVIIDEYPLPETEENGAC